MATILYFGPARERTGLDTQQLELQGDMTLNGLWDLLLESHPMLAALRDSCRIAVDQEYAHSDTPITNRSEIAIIPPVAGG